MSYVWAGLLADKAFAIGHREWYYTVKLGFNISAAVKEGDIVAVGWVLLRLMCFVIQDNTYAFYIGWIWGHGSRGTVQERLVNFVHTDNAIAFGSGNAHRLS
jgi:hypothetical protein